MAPRVSICVPNLNTCRFLPARFATIFAQTFQDWELVVCDSYSDDGAWEYIQDLARGEPRMQTIQTPRAGIYQGVNDCIERASGELIYIATSDDTMANDCIGKLVAALDANATCDIAHCPLLVINESGESVEFPWAEKSAFARSSGKLINRPHIRVAPYDGLLHLGAESVYISMTQLLIRRSLFGRIGVFDTRWGSAGDFHWAMRAGLVANVVHVPNTWAGWRIHPGQATDFPALASMAHRQKIEAMIDHALDLLRGQLRPEIELLVRKKRKYFWNQWELGHSFQQDQGTVSKLRLLLTRLATGSSAAWSYLGRRLVGKPTDQAGKIEVVAEWLAELGDCSLQECETECFRNGGLNGHPLEVTRLHS